MTLKFNNDHKLVVGLGAALIDIICHESDDFLMRFNAPKGGMTYVDVEFIERRLIELTCKAAFVPGGAACNTIIGIGQLGGRTRFVGKRGKGKFGALFHSALEENNVEPFMFSSDIATGRVLSIITPDAQRSMFTLLGASSEMRPKEITAECFADASIVFVEGYTVFNPDLTLAALQAAKAAGALIALDLASYTVVEESRAFLEECVREYVDILIANEDEARAFTGHSDEMRALQALSEPVEMAALKIGKRGSYIAFDGSITKIDPLGSGSAVDTTGAGDLWAAGLLFGLINGYPLEKCGELASACGYEVCQVDGAKIHADGWERIKKRLT